MVRLVTETALDSVLSMSMRWCRVGRDRRGRQLEAGRVADPRGRVQVDEAAVTRPAPSIFPAESITTSSPAAVVVPVSTMLPEPVVV